MASIDLGIPTITRLLPYTPTLNSGITGSVTSASYWCRVGQSINISGLLTFAGAGGATEDLTVALPSGLSFDTTVLPGGTSATNQAGSMMGNAYWFIQGSGWKFIYPVYNTSNTVYFVENTQHVGTNEFAAGDGFRYFINAPIKGW